MKKGWKRALSVLLVLMLLVSLSGCDALDMMRQAQAYYGENGEILHNGTTYKRLPEWGDLNPGYGYYDENYVNVTEPDVPVLLSGLICLEELILSNDKNFLISINDNNLYCREELYDSVCERIHQGFAAEVVCYYYYVYDEQTDGMEMREYVLTQEQVAAVDAVLETVEPATIGSDWYQDCEWMVTLEECSADRLFRRTTVDISVSQGIYYLICHETTETVLVYTVPQEYADMFAQIFSAYVEAEESWNYAW